MNSDLFAKIQSAFGDYAVDKKLAQRVEVSRLPRFVAEYLISEFAGSDGWEEKLRRFVSEYYHEPKERDLVLHNLTTMGSVKLIDELKVWVDVDSGMHYAAIPSLNIVDATVDMSIVEKNLNTLETGKWGLMTLNYSLDSVEKDGSGNFVSTPVLLTEFEPFQIPEFDFDLFKTARGRFSLDEWLAVLMNTVGLDHTQYSFRQKLVFLTRLVCLAEPNTHLMEFGPRATGKTYTYRNSSYYTRIIAGGSISPATLFYNLRTGQPGELAVRDAVIFDEVSKVRFQNPDEMMGKLKDFMDSGHYERGTKKGVSTASLVFMGNVDVQKSGNAYTPIAEDFTYVIPSEMRDSAFLDRIHGIIPGWELPKITQSKYHLSKGLGIASDYFAEVLHEMGRTGTSAMAEKQLSLSEDCTIRDEKAVKRVSSALIKLFFPNNELDKEDFVKVISYAVETRQRIRDWLHILAPGEFPLQKIGYELKQ